MMKLLDALPREAILSELHSPDKKGIIEELVMPISRMVGLEYRELVRVLMERERLGSTGIGGGIGIPHGKMKGLDRLLVGFGRSREGVDFDSIDGRPAHLFFVLITPEDSIDVHLRLLAQISRMLKNDRFKERLLAAADRDELLRVIREEDQSEK
ncbi:MAG: PTS sugar transporter subunit IIA [Desulfococcaceae bacterium]